MRTLLSCIAMLIVGSLILVLVFAARDAAVEASLSETLRIREGVHGEFLFWSWTTKFEPDPKYNRAVLVIPGPRFEKVDYSGQHTPPSDRHRLEKSMTVENALGVFE